MAVVIASVVSNSVPVDADTQGFDPGAGPGEGPGEGPGGGGVGPELVAVPSPLEQRACTSRYL